MEANVYFYNAYCSPRFSLIEKVKRLFKYAQFSKFIEKGDKIAIKVHWGEPGNVAFIPPPFIRQIVEEVKEAGGEPFVTDTNVLYTGMRHNAIVNLKAASMNGFTYETLGAPIIVADGLCGTDYVSVKIEKGRLSEAKVASAIFNADGMIVVSHVKGHMLFGYAGAIKNLGMGCTTPSGKQILHSDLKPKINPKSCKGCKVCIKKCPAEAICLLENNIAFIIEDKCQGCGECIVLCPERAIPINWETSDRPLQEKTVEYALSAIKNKRNKCGYINFLINITPDCDCCHWNDIPIVPDIGILASCDPLAIDQASIDLVNKAKYIPGSKIDGLPEGKDKFLALKKHPYHYLLEHGEEIGIGTRNYKLIPLDK